jgi:hypothetical protein
LPRIQQRWKNQDCNPWQRLQNEEKAQLQRCFDLLPAQDGAYKGSIDTLHSRRWFVLEYRYRARLKFINRRFIFICVTWKEVEPLAAT